MTDTLSETVDVSIVVCTFRRPALLAACLASLETQENPYGATEILVIDNCPDASAAAVVQGAAAGFERRGVALRHVAEARTGVAHARNRSLAEARHPVIAFIDDDEHAAPGWLRLLLRPFAELGARVDIVAGEVEPDFAGQARPDWLTDDYLHALSCRWGWDTAPRFLKPNEWFGEGNCAFRKALFAGRGFNVALGRRDGALSSSEGVIFQKLRQEGARAYYEPRAVAFHHIHRERMERKWLLRRMFNHGMSDVIACRDVGGHVDIGAVGINLKALVEMDVEGLDSRDFHGLMKIYYFAGYAFGSHMQ